MAAAEPFDRTKQIFEYLSVLGQGLIGRFGESLKSLPDLRDLARLIDEALQDQLGERVHGQLVVAWDGGSVIEEGQYGWIGLEEGGPLGCTRMDIRAASHAAFLGPLQLGPDQ